MKIPIVKATTDIPTGIPVTVRPESAGMEWGAVQGLGQQVQGLVLQISEEERKIRDRLQAGQDEITSVRKKSDFSFWKQGTDKELDETPEIQPWDRQAVYLARANQKKAELLSDVTDKFLRQKLEAELDRDITVSGIEQGAKGIKKSNEKIEAETQDEMLRLANKGDYAGVKNLAESLVNLGIKSPQWAKETVNKHTEEGEKALITAKASSEDIGVLTELKKDIDKATKLSPLEKEIYKAHIANKINTLEEKAKRERKEQASTFAFNDIKSTYGDNYELALTALADPQYAEALQKKYEGLDLNGIASIRAGLHNEKNIRDEKIKVVHDNTAAENFVNIDKLASDSGRGVAQINQQVKDKLLDWKMGEHFKNAIINPPSIKDDPAAYFSIVQKLVQLDLTDADRYEIMGEILQSKNLSIETKKTLGKDVIASKEDEHIFNDPWFKFADKSIKQELGWTDLMGFGNLSPDKAQEAVGSYGKVIRQLLNDIKTKKYRGQEIDQRARELLLPEKIKVWEELMGGPKTEKKVKEKYDIGNVYTDPEGNKAKYLGNGKWMTQEK